MADILKLEGRTILVTGATRGIGLAIAKELIDQGALVVITGRKLESLQAIAMQLGDRAIPLVCHQGEPQSIARLYQELDARKVVLDGVVINAATNPVFGAIIETELAAWMKIFEVNVTGAFLTAQAAAKRMRERKEGSILFIASVAGIEPMAGIGAYSVSKAGMLGLMRVLAKELGGDGIRVNALAPGLIETKFSTALLQDKPRYERFLSSVPLGRHGQPEDVVGAALFLLSDASRYMTGQVVVVDGGSRV